MKTPEIRRILSDISRKVFEEAAFALVDDPAESAAEGGGARLAVSLSFEGLFGGALSMVVSGETARIAAANMLGVEEDDPDAGEKAKDAAGELLNMICGNLLPAVTGPEPEFRITPPVEISADEYAKQLAGAAPGETIEEILCIEGREVRIAFRPEAGFDALIAK